MSLIGKARKWTNYKYFLSLFIACWPPPQISFQQRRFLGKYKPDLVEARAQKLLTKCRPYDCIAFVSWKKIRFLPSPKIPGHKWNEISATCRIYTLIIAAEVTMPEFAASVLFTDEATCDGMFNMHKSHVRTTVSPWAIRVRYYYQNLPWMCRQGLSTTS